MTPQLQTKVCDGDGFLHHGLCLGHERRLDRQWARAHSEGETNRPKQPIISSGRAEEIPFVCSSSRIERERSSTDQRLRGQ